MKQYVASHLKDMNRKVVFNYIMEKKVTCKAEIAKDTRISAPTVIKIVDYLSKNQLISEIGEGEATIGRRPHLLAINNQSMYAASFILEGVFLSMGIVDISSNVIYKKTIRIEPELTSIMHRIANGLIDEMFAEAGMPMDKLFGIGIALPAIYNKESRTITNAPLIGVFESLCINDILVELETKYNAPTYVENDANAQCLGEYSNINKSVNPDLVFVSVGTGLGAGIILDGKLRRGINNMGGEIGYSIFSENYVMDSKNPGWLESKISYKVLEDKFDLQLYSTSSEIPLFVITKMIDYVSDVLALSIANINYLLDISDIVCGGEVITLLGEGLIDAINEKLTKLSINPIEVRLQSTDNNGLIGIVCELYDSKITEILTK